MPRHDECSHKNCDGEPCKQLTDEELEPGEDDLRYAGELICNGWRSVSNKYRTVANLPEDFPQAEQMIAPEMLNTHHGRELAKSWNYHRKKALRTNEAITEDLTVKQWRAFKKLGGDSA